MGQCSSCMVDCLGMSREEPDHARLLPAEYPSNGTFTDGNRAGGYGAAGGVMRGEVDPQDQIREREALEQIVVNASMNLIDIFAQPPQHQPQQPPMVNTMPSGAPQHMMIQAPQGSYVPQYPGMQPQAQPPKQSGRKTSSGSRRESTTNAAAAAAAAAGYNQAPGYGNVGYAQMGGGKYGGHDAKRMAIYRALLQRTSPPQPPVMPQVLAGDVISEDERAWLEEIGQKAEEAVGCLTRVRGVGKVVVGLEVGGD